MPNSPKAATPAISEMYAVEPAVAGEIVILDPNEVTLGERLRPIDPIWAEALGRSMARDGQIHPIHVCRLPGQPGWHLAGPGGHRLMGARLASIAIEAKAVSPDRDGHRRREAAENVFRRANDPLERAEALAELVRLHKLRAGIDPTKDGRAASANARWAKREIDADADDAKITMSLAYGWTDELAEQIGVSPALIKRDLYLYRNLSPSLAARLREHRHPVATNGAQLRALAKLDTDQQARIVEQLLTASPEQSPAKTVSEAQARLSGANRLPSDADTKRLSAFIGSFQRMGLAEKKGGLAELRPLIPAGSGLGEGADTASALTAADLSEIRSGLEAAFSLLLKLSDGEPVEDDEINTARVKTQKGLWAVNAAARSNGGGKA